MNLLAAVGVGLALGIPPATIGARALAAVTAVPGPASSGCEAGQPFLVVVDYAHTPDALERVLTTARQARSPAAGAWARCSAAGGDRDRGQAPHHGRDRGAAWPTVCG